jgi:hypothetical protein
MSKIKYKFNTKSLTYEKVKVSYKEKVFRLLSYLATGTVFAFITIIIAYSIIESPKEKRLQRELDNMKLQYEIVSERMNNMNVVLNDLQNRDDNIYRMIFEAEPIPDYMRKAGYGGSDRYSELDGYDNSELIIETTKRMDKLSKEMYVQSKSFDELVKLATNKEQMLASIPAIMPIESKNLKHPPSGFGWRTHHIYKTQDFHPGMDFTAAIGTKIYATGDGVVEHADADMQGYGNHVIINHGFGYETLYGHMSRMAVYPGQKIKRGELIGYVGNTGLSTGPHVHYEVIKNGEKINPVHYYFNDLTPEQYKELIEVTSNPSQSFD